MAIDVVAWCEGAEPVNSQWRAHIRYVTYHQQLACQKYTGNDCFCLSRDPDVWVCVVLPYVNWAAGIAYYWTQS